MNPYTENIQTLSSLYSSFRKDILDHYQPDPEMTIESTPEGGPTALLHRRYLHSKHKPVREAERLVMSICGESSGGVGVFLGFGLGYQIEAFCRHFPESPIIIVESRPSLFLSALGARDLTHLFHAHTSLLLGSSVEDLSPLLAQHTGEQIHLLPLASVCEQDSEYYQRAREITEAAQSRRKVNRATLRRFGKRWVRNLAHNIEVLDTAGNVGDWESLFQNTPTCIFAAGPSLDEALPFLDMVQRRALLICSDTAARFLLREGITPDFVVLVDPQYWNTRHLDGLDLSKSILISEPAAHPNIFHGDFRAIYLSGSIFPLGSFLEKDGGERHRLGAGGSVATTAWDFGRLVGGEPLMCAGLDLGFPAGKTHFGGSYFEERIRSHSSRLTPHEQGIFKYLHSGYPFFYEDYEGRKILTDKRFEVYRQWFEEQIALQSRISSDEETPPGQTSAPRSLTLSTTGIRIRGIEPCDIRDIASFPERRDEINKKIDSLLTAGTTVSNARRGSTQARVAALLLEMKELRQKACAGVETVDRILSLEKETDEPSRSSCLEGRGLSTRSSKRSALLEHLNGIDHQILHHSSRKIAAFLISPILQEIEEKAGLEKPTLKENLLLTRQLYQEMRGAIDFHTDLFLQ